MTVDQMAARGSSNAQSLFLHPHSPPLKPALLARRGFLTLLLLLGAKGDAAGRNAVMEALYKAAASRTWITLAEA